MRAVAEGPGAGFEELLGVFAGGETGEGDWGAREEAVGGGWIFGRSGFDFGDGLDFRGGLDFAGGFFREETPRGSDDSTATWPRKTGAGAIVPQRLPFLGRHEPLPLQRLELAPTSRRAAFLLRQKSEPARLRVQRRGSAGGHVALQGEHFAVAFSLAGGFDVPAADGPGGSRGEQSTAAKARSGSGGAGYEPGAVVEVPGARGEEAPSAADDSTASSHRSSAVAVLSQRRTLLWRHRGCAPQALEQAKTGGCTRFLGDQGGEHGGEIRRVRRELGALARGQVAAHVEADAVAFSLAGMFLEATAEGRGGVFGGVLLAGADAGEGGGGASLEGAWVGWVGSWRRFWSWPWAGVSRLTKGAGGLAPQEPAALITAAAGCGLRSGLGELCTAAGPSFRTEAWARAGGFGRTWRSLAWVAWST